ncbi:penicillin acylase family protein [Saccharothrix syringae]|uniref:Peptidase S45 n=1 Tax=Saccharothrix syringae TaxID=103733 RepID=A0A5Q0H0G0_SACSY|nr:penicillin acylase family protein [Saccharothrix syringae]QFZ19751.1 peptidase S45 [Saccharothrix syringae]
MRLCTWWALVLVVLAGSTGLAPVAAGGPPPGGGVLVRRTAYGVPHVLAADHRGLGFGAGYAVAEDNLCLLADIAVTLSAERSRWFGAEARTPDGVGNLDSDLHQQRVNQTGVVERLLARPAPLGPSGQARELVRGYVAGYNRYLAETGVANLPDPACRGAAWVRPLTELDLWRRAHQLATSLDDGFQDALVGAQPPGEAAPAAAGASWRRPEDVGSNAYALGRRATVGGTGMVLANPHLPWVGPYRLYQLHLTIPGELNVSGAAFLGVPMVGIGHNDRLAWTHTASTAAPVALARLTLAPGDPRAYVVDGRVRPMERDDVTVAVRRPDGGLDRVTRTLYRTEHGPLFEDDGELAWTDTTAYAVRDPNATNLRVVDQWLAMAKARDVHGLHATQERLLGVPVYNTLAADADGTAYFGALQVVPHITDELAARCATGPRVGLTILDGSRSDCAWGRDPDAVEPGLLGPARLPVLFRHDHVSNMNNSPWLANPAAPLTGYPAVVGDVGTQRSPRTRLGLDMIADRLTGEDGLGPAGFTLPTLQATTFGNRNLTAEQGRAAVVAMCAADPAPVGSDGTPVDVRAACAALAGWDGRGDLDARGAVLWREFVDRLGRSGVDPWRVPFDPADPTGTPRGFDTARPGVSTAFADTVRAFQTAGVPVDLRLGDFQRHEGVPVHGCASFEGCFNAVSAGTASRPTGVTRGSTFVMAVELTPSGPRARTILIYGQSGDPTSPHHLDQTRLHSAKQWVVGRFTEAEIARDPELVVRRLTP